MVGRGVNKAGQVTIFVILAIVLVVAVASYFIFKDTIFPIKISSTFEPIETNFLNCIQEKTQTGIKIIESKGGYISDPIFVSGSQYMPFSSQLDFLGVSIPYWHSVSGNNFEINQVPTKEEIQNQLANYLNKEIPKCNFNSFTKEGFSILRGDPNTEVSIKDHSVQVILDMDLNVGKGEESANLANHKVEVNSELGSLYSDAIKFYDQEEKESFLENYSVDILRNYAPVDGVELTCAPKIWNANEIFDTLKIATQDNFLALKNSGEKTDYFNLNIPVDSEIKVFNSIDWPNSYEVDPTNSQILVSKPVGTQQGLGILGFCYVPYHFVYNIKYPVLVQLTRNDETFQFPLAIILEGNVAKKSTSFSPIQENTINLCEGPFSNLTVSLISSNLNSVEGEVSYDCLGSSCYIGLTKDGILKGVFPQCANGKIVVNSQGYKEKSEFFSTVNDGVLSLVMDKNYEKQVFLKVQNSHANEKAIIYFSLDDESNIISYPERNKINLSAGTYEVKIYLYDNSSIKFDASTIQQCVEVPSGIGGIFGITHQECSNSNVPAQNLTNVLIGGGSGSFTFSEADLSSNKKLEISVERYNSPSSLQELQIVYTLVDAKGLGVKFI